MDKNCFLKNRKSRLFHFTLRFLSFTYIINNFSTLKSKKKDDLCVLFCWIVYINYPKRFQQCHNICDVVRWNIREWRRKTVQPSRLDKMLAVNFFCKSMMHSNILHVQDCVSAFVSRTQLDNDERVTKPKLQLFSKILRALAGTRVSY